MNSISDPLPSQLMQAASLSDLKKELEQLSPKAVKELCLRLAKYKKENKELLTYLLFEAGNEQGYIRGIQDEMDEAFAGINKGSLYYAAKNLRKILRMANKYIKYSGNKQTEVEVLMYYCLKVMQSGLPVRNSTALANLYQRQLDKITKAISKLHEDLQYDYEQELAPLLRFL